MPFGWVDLRKSQQQKINGDGLSLNLEKAVGMA
jgi:hypothetical protein